MTKHHHRPKHSARYGWVSLGCATALFWLWALFYFPRSWQDYYKEHYKDDYGVIHLAWILATGCLQFVLGWVLIFAAYYRQVGERFAYLVMYSSLVYPFGVVFPRLLCLIPFMVPPCLILIMAFFELRPTRA